MLHAQAEQVPVRLADDGTGRDAEDLHDLLAVEVRPDLGQLLLPGELGDPLLEVVVGRGQAHRLATVPRRAVGPGEAVQPLQQVAGVGDVPAHRGVGPLALAVAVEAQVQLDQPGDVLDGLLVEPQRPQTLGRHPRADELVVVEAHPATGLEATRRRLADVVEQRGQPQHQVGPRHRAVRAGLQRDGLVEDDEGVLVDVLVPAVLVDGALQLVDLGQHDGRHPGVDHELDPTARALAEDEPLELGADPLGGDDLQPVGHRRHRRHDVGVDVEAQLGAEARRPHDAQRVVVEGLLRVGGGAQHTGVEVLQPAERVDEGERGEPHRHRVDAEVAAGQVALEGVAVGDHRLAGVGLVLLGAVGRHLDDDVAAAGADRAELLADVPVGGAPRGEQPLGLLGTGGGGEVEVVAHLAEEGVTDRAADERQLVSGVGEGGPELEDSGRQRGERGGRRAHERGRGVVLLRHRLSLPRPAPALPCRCSRTAADVTKTARGRRIAQFR